MPSPLVCVGIDLAGVDRVETGFAVLRDGRLSRLEGLSTEVEIIRAVRKAGRRAVVAINAPLTRPAGRCCLDDDCPCRQDPGTRSRVFERLLRRLGIPTLATGILKRLAWRGQRLAMALRVDGYDPIEVYPYASFRLLGLTPAGKRTPAGRQAIHACLRRRVRGLNHPDATDHQLDALACAWTAHLHALGRSILLGSPLDGFVVLPSRRRRRPPH
jgi:predicted nuclease with RNAse H fold